MCIVDKVNLNNLLHASFIANRDPSKNTPWPTTVPDTFQVVAPPSGTNVTADGSNVEDITKALYPSSCGGDGQMCCGQFFVGRLHLKKAGPDFLGPVLNPVYDLV